MTLREDYTSRLAARLGPQMTIVRPPFAPDRMNLPIVKESTGDSRAIYHHQQYSSAPLRSSRSVQFDQHHRAYPVAVNTIQPAIVSSREVMHSSDMKGSFLSEQQDNHHEYNLRNSYHVVSGQIPPQGLASQANLHSTLYTTRSVSRGPVSSERDIQGMRSSRVSQQRETVHMGEPREVSRTKLQPRQLESKDLKPVLITVNTHEATTRSEFTNLRQMLIDCYKRIVLMGMENDRLQAKNADYNQIIAELRARVSTLELEVGDFDKLLSERTYYQS